MFIRTTILSLLFFLLSPGIFGQTPVIDSLKQELGKSSPNTRFELLLQLAENFRLLNPDTSLFYAGKALSVASTEKSGLKRIKAEYYVASYDYMIGKPEEGLAIAGKNIAILQKDPTQNSLLAQYSSFSGLCLMKLNRIKEALDEFYIALKLSEQNGDYQTQLRATVNIGWAMMELNQYEKAIGYFNNGLKLMEEQNLTRSYNGTIYNNLAACYGALNQLDSSLKYSTVAISEARKTENLGAEANGLFILGTTQTKQGKYNEALQSFLTAKPIRKKIGDPYYMVSDMAEMGNLYAKLKKPAEGISICRDALQIATKNKIDAKLPMIYSALAANYESAGNYKDAADVYKKISDLKDSVYAKANPRALAEMQTKYESEKKERLIQQQKFHITRQNFLIGIAIGILILGSLLGYSQYKRYRSKQEVKLKNELMRQQHEAARAVLEAGEKERQRIAKDLHDSIGQMMSAAKMNLSAFESEIKFETKEQQRAFEKVIQLVDESCREVRNVSHNMMPNALLKNNLASAIQEFVDKLDQRTLHVHLYTEGIDERLDSNIETVLYRIVQECVNNVIKHANATNLDISLIRDRDGISATIEDNGVGFDTADKEKYRGMGLKNIITRVEYLKGTVEFDSTPGKGTLVALHVPAG